MVYVNVYVFLNEKTNDFVDDRCSCKLAMSNATIDTLCCDGFFGFVYRSILHLKSWERLWMSAMLY